jgi:hypothetical protein
MTLIPVIDAQKCKEKLLHILKFKLLVKKTKLHQRFKLRLLIL